MGKLSVTKGKCFEREVAVQFAAAMPGSSARRGLSQPRGGGREEPDVLVPWFHVECKRGKRPNIPRAVMQALADCDHLEHLWPLAVTRADHDRALATMHLDDFLALVKEWYMLKMHGREE